MRMPGPAIALVAAYGPIGILEIVYTWWGAFTGRLEGVLAYHIDALAQAPLAIVLLAGLAGLSLGRRWSARALLIYAAGGVSLGLASALGIAAHGAPRALEAGYGWAPAIVGGIILFVINSGFALVLLLLISSRRIRRSLFQWMSEPRVA